MQREGPGFLADLAIVFCTYAFILLTAEFVTSTLGLKGMTSTAAGLAIALVVIFLVLVGYYRTFLDETPVVGT